MKAVKYIIILAIAAIGIYNLIGQTSSMPLFFAVECFCLCGVLALHKEEPVCGQE